MDVQRGPVRRSHREPLTPSPIILPAEAIAVTLLILVAWPVDLERRIKPAVRAGPR